MKLFQFLAHTANQVGRFAPEAEVPEEWAQLAVELGNASNLDQVDAPLIEPFKVILGEAYRQILGEAHSAITQTVKGRLEALSAQREQARQQLLAEHAAATQRANELEQLRAKHHEMVEDHGKRISELEQLISALKK